MTRTRFIYSKRHGACFVPHIALAQIFSRSARRAGIELEMTQGFSPRAKISFGPELPAGVVALNECVDMFLLLQDLNNHNNLIDDMNNSLPEGFSISRVIFPDEDSPSLGKLCRHAEYLLRSSNLTCEDLIQHAKNFYNASIIKSENQDSWLRIILSEPAQNPIGGLVKNMISENIINGWHEINIVRVSIGKYNHESDKVSL